jgi:sec-independent protein translocase protein TatC
MTTFLELFNSWVYFSFVLTILVGSPWLLYQLWQFVAPGLYGHERRFVYLLAPLSVVLALTSALFTYFVMLPVILHFFVVFNSTFQLPATATNVVTASGGLPAVPVLHGDPPDPAAGSMWINSHLNQFRVCVAGKDAEHAHALIRGTPLTVAGAVAQNYNISTYINLILNLALAFATAFQMPVVVLILGWVGIVTPAFLKRYRKHAVFVCAFLGAALTPGDPLSMVLLAIPLWMLYELGIFLLATFPASRVGARPAQDPEGLDAEPLAGAGRPEP